MAIAGFPGRRLRFTSRAFYARGATTASSSSCAAGRVLGFFGGFRLSLVARQPSSCSEGVLLPAGGLRRWRRQLGDKRQVEPEEPEHAAGGSSANLNSHRPGGIQAEPDLANRGADDQRASASTWP